MYSVDRTNDIKRETIWGFVLSNTHGIAPNNEQENKVLRALLELGRGFMFVGTQQRVTVNNTHYNVAMVFYNKILHAYVLIELKTTKLTPEAAGQINMYLKLRKKKPVMLIASNTAARTIGRDSAEKDSEESGRDDMKQS